MAPVEVTSVVDGRTARLYWHGQPDVEALSAALTTRCGELFADGVERVEARVSDDRRYEARAVHHAGFRQEGRRRQAVCTDDGQWVDEWLYARLRDDVVDTPEAFSAVMNTVLPRKRVMAHVLFRNGHGEFLFCDTVFKSDWELPGGIVEPDEPPRVGAQREVAEELGLDVELGRLLVMDWLPPWLGWEDALAFVFDGGTLSDAQIAAITPQAAEIVAVHFCTLTDAWDQLTERARRRYAVATQLGDRPTAYLEAGHPHVG